jgi:hypothetical protein
MTTATQPDLSLVESGSWIATADQPVTAAQIYAGEHVGYQVGRPGRDANPRYREALMRTFDLIEAVQSGNPYAALKLREAMTTSDFPHLFGDALDRMLYGAYQQAPVRWDLIARRGTVRDFRPVKRFAVDGAEAVLPEVAEESEYPAAALSETPYTYAVTKRGRRVPMSWETWLNGDLGQFRDLPQRLANAARKTEEKFVTQLYATSTGPNPAYFNAGNNNVVPGNPPLSVTALQDALTVMGEQVDEEGEPIYVEGITLVVPRSLEVTGRNILNSIDVWAATGGGDGVANNQLRINNWMRDQVTLLVNPWLPIVDTTSGNDAWYVFASPNSGRPALEIGFLIGHEAPEIWMKSANAVRVGGGAVAPEMGDFDSDTIQWRIRHVLGGSTIDHRMAVASTGLGDGS